MKVNLMLPSIHSQVKERRREKGIPEGIVLL
jgi:hypothetical protein